MYNSTTLVPHIIGAIIAALLALGIAYGLCKLFGWKFNKKVILIIITVSFISFFLQMLSDILISYGMQQKTIVLLEIVVAIVGIVFVFLFCRKKK